MKKLVILAAIAVAAGLASCKEHVPTPVFKTGVDSLSYAMGMARSQGLKPFLVARMNVDTTYMDEFQRGFLKYVDAVKAKDITYMAGMQIGSQIANQMIPGANNELFGPDSKKSIRMEDFIKGFEAGVMGQKTKMTMEQATEYYQYTLKSVRTERAALPDSSKKDISMTSAQLDSVSYAIGLSMTQDLKQYLVARENVDTTYMHDFVKGFKETVKGTSAREVALMAGMQIGNQVSNQIIPMANREVFGETTTDSLNRNNFIAGFLAGTTGINEKMSMAVAEEYTTTALSEIQTKALMAEFGANKAAGEAYMLENAKKGDVITTPSGLQYRIIQEGLTIAIWKLNCKNSPF